MDQLRASLNWSFDTSKVDETDINNSPWGGSGGNPELRPWIANAFDISYEKYLDDGIGYFAIAAFYKDLDSWVNETPTVYDFTGFPTGEYDPVLNEGLVSIPQNEGGGDIYGFELAGALDFGYFADVLSGFGLMRMPGGFVPIEDQGYFMVNAQLPNGASLERTQEVMEEINEQMLALPNVRAVATAPWLLLPAVAVAQEVEGGARGDAALVRDVGGPGDARVGLGSGGCTSGLFRCGGRR